MFTRMPAHGNGIGTARAPTSAPSIDGADIVIIGNGIAGLTAAIDARHHAPEKRIVIITDQVHPTIYTPALKQYALGKLTRAQLLASPVGTERTQRLHVLPGRVEEINAQSHCVTIGGRGSFGYASLLIATGGVPIGIPMTLAGRDFDGVLTLNRLPDYLDLRRRLHDVRTAVIVGGGVHALETAMTLATLGISVHWLIRGETFMRGILDRAASELVLTRARRVRGVSIQIHTEVAGILGHIGSVAGVMTSHRLIIACELVVFCTGTQAATAIASHCTLPMQHGRGISVDHRLRTSVPDIYAAGDVAAPQNPLDGEHVRRAQWYASVMQGHIAGAMLSGHAELAPPPCGVPWHATNLCPLALLTVGDPLIEGPSIETLTDSSNNGYRRMTISGDRLLGYLSLGHAHPDSLSMKRIVEEGHPIRNDIDSLLTGKFDARSYLSSQRSRVVQGLLTGKLPPPVVPPPSAVSETLPRGPSHSLWSYADEDLKSCVPEYLTPLP